MTRLFISHSSHDDAFVRNLRMALADHGQDGWIDSRELRGGDPLWPEIQRAIEAASAYAVLVSPDGLQSKWVGMELRYALQLQEQRGRDNYPVIPLSLNDTKLGVLEEFFGEEPLYISVSSNAGGVEAAVHPILVALGKRLPTDLPPMPQPPAEPLEELILELTRLGFHEIGGRRRASATARLVYQPTRQGQREVASLQRWQFLAPIGPLEAGELSWYLEQYAIWPSNYFRDRARKVEADLAAWGKILYQAAIPISHTANVMQAWAQVGGRAGRRFSVYVDTTIDAGAPETELRAAREAANELLNLPWELLHDGRTYLFQGANPTRVRRRLPNISLLDVPVVNTPIRILLVTARPEDDACGYIDHRASAMPLVEAMESLPGLVQLHILSPPTLPRLRQELDRARDAGTPYHVIHFDGHGVYDRALGLGGLCFEDPTETGKLERRGHKTVYTEDRTEYGTGLGSLLRDHRIPLVFLEACQTAQAEKASESVASELLRDGVASVVAMSHSVLVETASRFVEAIYRALAEGRRVGSAMLEGQRQLKDDTFRAHVFGAGELRLEDWFVPVLFQEKDDPQLFQAMPSRQTKADFLSALTHRLGKLPQPPEIGFIGRSRELLALQRLLREGGARYAVIRGQGGEGKTALATEFARWMVRSQQVRRAAFVSVETHSHAQAVLNAIGRQLVPDYSVAVFESMEAALQPIERVLIEQSTMLIVDNVESLLLPPYLAEDASETLSEDLRYELAGILALCERLNTQGETRLLFTSREPLPAPFDSVRSRLELFKLSQEDAIKLVERTLNTTNGSVSDSAREEIEELVDAVHAHARTLTLLAPSIRAQGVAATRASHIKLMEEMEERFPGNREKSVFASVELSLRRLSPENQERARVLGIFHGGVQLDVLHKVMQWKEADVASLATGLIKVGLATPNPNGHLTLNPALCPYLRRRMDTIECETLTTRWVDVMRGYSESLDQNITVASTLTNHELPNLLACLDLIRRAGNPEATIDYATTLYSLLRNFGKPRLLEHVGWVRDGAAAELGDAWTHARFLATVTRIDQQLAGGHLRDALTGAQQLLQCARAAGKESYPEADYDLASAYQLMGQVYKTIHKPDEALLLLDEALQRFELIETRKPGFDVGCMVTLCVTEKGNCYCQLGKYDKAVEAYDESIRRAKNYNDIRQIAVVKGQLGTVRMRQRRFPEALAAHKEALKLFKDVKEPGSVATSIENIGLVHQKAGRPDKAEKAYHKSLEMKVNQKDIGGQAGTLLNLGNLYNNDLNRLEHAERFYQQAADKFHDINDWINESRARNNRADALRKLRRFNDARKEIQKVTECIKPNDQASEPWKPWHILTHIEIDAGDFIAARDAKIKAIDNYLTYRRNGGENHDPVGRIAYAITQALLSGDLASATSQLQAQVPLFEAEGCISFISALHAIVAGSRDRALADTPDLNFSMAAEIILLIETLEKSR